MINIIGKTLKTTKDVYEYYTSVFKRFKREHVIVIGIKKCKVICTKDVTETSKKGEAVIDVTDTFSYLKSQHCDGFVIAHNHPNGFPLPSKQDISFTELLDKRGKEHHVRLIEHLVYSGCFWGIVEDTLKHKVVYK